MKTPGKESIGGRGK
jgi:hypothetical protein